MFKECFEKAYVMIYLSISSASCLPWIPEKGTVGASGDLAPLSHLALGMMGEGKMWSPKSGWADAKYVNQQLSPNVIKVGFGLLSTKDHNDVIRECIMQLYLFMKDSRETQ